MENAGKDFWAEGTRERLEAHRLQAIEDQRTISLDKQKKMNTARANVYASQQPTATQIRTDKRFKADDKSIRKMIETLDFKKMAGKKDRVVDLIDDIAELLGLQPRFIPVRVKNKNKEKKK